MKSKKGSLIMLRILYVIAWIIFIGVSIEAGSSLTASFFAIYNPSFVKNLMFWNTIDLSQLWNFSQKNYVSLVFGMSAIAVLRAVLFYTIIKFMHEKKFDFSQPFTKRLGLFISRLAYLSIIIGLLSASGAEYVEWIQGKSITMPSLETLRLAGADVWLFMGVTLLLIAQIIKRGIEIQTENELTI